jgi:hypothetical protein
VKREEKERRRGGKKRKRWNCLRSRVECGIGPKWAEALMRWNSTGLDWTGLD